MHAAKTKSSIIILKGTRLEFYLFRESLQAPLRPVRILDAVPVADTEQHLELRLRGRAPSARTKLARCLLLHGMHVSHVQVPACGEKLSAWWGKSVGGGDILVPYQSQVLELCDLILLPGHAQQWHLDLVVLRLWGIGNGLGQGHVCFGVGRLNQRPHERLGCLGGLGARCPRGDVDRVDDSFETICGQKNNRVSN